MATVLSMRVSKLDAVAFLTTTEHEDFPILLAVDEAARHSAYRLFKKITDKDISMIDCYSAILMKQNNLQNCFTFDQQFIKLGFKILE